MKRGWRNIATWVGAVIVGIAAFCALAAPLLVPHDPFAQDLGRLCSHASILVDRDGARE